MLRALKFKDTDFVTVEEDPSTVPLLVQACVGKYKLETINKMLHAGCDVKRKHSEVPVVVVGRDWCRQVCWL